MPIKRIKVDKDRPRSAEAWDEASLARARRRQEKRTRRIYFMVIVLPPVTVLLVYLAIH